ncbi:hypothetical protein CU097_009723 [Rhizopus azygosporus]|uniref:Uncharacterized protein n=1 Tax=Rhizopus azygosporus TaxID=86630 RepID=A0A367K114_RHIAZ|nr:hypothetical protein CU097_009723 [Rhizopus azygosporus]
MGSRGDVFLKFQDQELGSSEVEKNTVLPTDDKYLNGGLMKLPKTLRDMLSVFVQTNPSRISHFISVKFLVIRLNLELLVADIPVGFSITRISQDRQTKIPLLNSQHRCRFYPTPGNYLERKRAHGTNS